MFNYVWELAGQFFKNIVRKIGVKIIGITFNKIFNKNLINTHTENFFKNRFFSIWGSNMQKNPKSKC